MPSDCPAIISASPSQPVPFATRSKFAAKIAALVCGELQLEAARDGERPLRAAQQRGEVDRLVAGHQRIQSPLRVAILTLLNLTDELLSERRDAFRLASGVEERARRLEALMAAAMPADSGNHPPDRGWSD